MRGVSPRADILRIIKTAGSRFQELHKNQRVERIRDPVAFRSDGLLLEIFCKLFGHRRSALHRRRFEGMWQSTCLYCDTQLVRLDSGNWVEKSSPEGEKFIRVAAQPALHPLPDNDLI